MNTASSRWDRSVPTPAMSGRARSTSPRAPSLSTGTPTGHLPQGATSISWSDQPKATGTPLARIHSAVTDRAACPPRAKCTTATNGEWGRGLTLPPRKRQEVLAQRREEQQTDEWKKRYDTRAGVEGTISQAVRRTGIRRTRYTTLPKTHLGNILAATAINIIRLDAWLTQTPLGGTRTSHLARLELAA
ncbi:transposase [Streptomyces vinaceus]